MKKIIYGLALSLSALAFVSCEINDPNADKFGNDPVTGWVEFMQPYEEIMTDTLFTAGCDVSVPLTLRAPINTDGVEVFYTITDIEGSSAGLETFASIPANGREGSFVVTNSEILTSPVEFLVTLSSTSNPGIGPKFPDTADQTMIVRILPTTQAFVGPHHVVEDSSDGIFEYESQITLGTAPNQYFISNLFGTDPDSQTSVTINADGTLSFPEFMDNFLFTTSGGASVYFEGLDGTSDPCSGAIEINFNLRSGANGVNVTGPINVVLTRS